MRHTKKWKKTNCCCIKIDLTLNSIALIIQGHVLENKTHCVVLAPQKTLYCMLNHSLGHKFSANQNAKQLNNLN